MRLALFLLPVALLAQPTDPVLDAMKAELQRSSTLSLNNLEKPYFIAYTVDDVHSWSASATLGGIVNANANTYRVPSVSVRVGDYKFDNSNFAGGRGGGARYDLRNFPIDDDPLVIRQYLWLATDSGYKSGLQTIARKRSAIRSVTLSDQLPDFSKVPAFTLVKPWTPVKFDDKTWQDRIRRISKTFEAFPKLRTSFVEYSVSDELHRFVNSEGTEIHLPGEVGSVQMRASAQAPDGMIVRDSAFFYTKDIAKLFPEADLDKAAKDLGETVMKMAAAPMGENYSGPVLFEGEASAQMLAEILGRNLHIARKGVATPGMPAAAAVTELEGRRGVRIMPEFFDVTDDPTKPNMFGSEEVDDEGVPEKPLSLVEKGVLKDFFRTREPVRGYTDSNGRARLGGSGPTPTNLIVTAHETTPISDIKQKMIDLCKQRDLNYAIVIRRMDFPSTAPIDEARKIMASAGAGHPVSIPLHIYKLYLDGHEELIRGVRLRGLNARSLKDILAAGDDTVTFNYLENGAPFALLGYGNGSAEVSVVAPSLLIDDLELVKVEDELPHLPIAGPPTAQ
jgi:hypothetical protein